MSAEEALQKGLRALLVGAPGVTALVPVSSILDRNSLPAPDPSIVIGEHQVLEGDDIARANLMIVSTVHIWKKEPSLAGVRAIGGAIRAAVRLGRLALDGGYHCGDCRVTGTLYLRDPDGQTSHGVVTINSLISEPN